MPDLPADARTVLEVAGHPAAYVVSVSMEGSVGQLLALDHPSVVRSLTIISGAPGGPD